MPKQISLALIVKDEAQVLERCVRSLQGLYDELIVCDTGSTDNTVEIAKSLGAKVIYHAWADHFGTARQAAFDACTHDLVMWCDADDYLREGDLEKLKKAVQEVDADIYSFYRFVVDRNNHVEREFIVDRRKGSWRRRIHEEFVITHNVRKNFVQDVKLIHPQIRQKSHDRNISLILRSLQETGNDFFYLAGEYHLKKDNKAALRTAELAIKLPISPIEKYELLLIMALSAESLEASVKHAMSAYALDPRRREALVLLTQTMLKYNRNAEALAYAKAFSTLPKPKDKIWTLQDTWYGWEGVDLYMMAMRRNGLYLEATKFESALIGNEQPTFSLIHATRGRPDKMVDARDIWFKRAKSPIRVEHIFAVDSDDAEAIKVAKDFRHIIVPAGGGCVAAWNEAAKFSGGKVLIQLSDDWVPPIHWDRLLLERLGEKINSEYVVAVSDGIDRGGGTITECMCLAIMTRDRYNFQGHMFFDGYKSVYSDNEFTIRAKEDDIIIDARDLVFEHRHYSTGQAQEDQTYKDQNAPERYRDGQALLNKRMQPKQGLDRDYAAFILAAKDDFCLEEVCQRLTEEGVKSLWFGVPIEYWNGKQNTRENRDEVHAIASKFPGAQLIMLDVRKYRAPDRHILTTEAMVRNEMLDLMRAKGHDHVVVADGDELWARGTLKLLDRYISDNKPPSLNMGMIPVAGLPGYPIQGARDIAMVYLGPGCRFKSCRGSEGDQYLLPRKQIMHFTATRKTMDEIIQKHRESGHYGDIEYSFEDWIVNTLPNIKPGFKRAHMFTRWDTWPLVREFTEKEWAQIPESIKPYLGKI